MPVSLLTYHIRFLGEKIEHTEFDQKSLRGIIDSDPDDAFRTPALLYLTSSAAGAESREVSELPPGFDYHGDYKYVTEWMRVHDHRHHPDFGQETLSVHEDRSGDHVADFVVPMVDRVINEGRTEGGGSVYVLRRTPNITLWNTGMPWVDGRKFAAELQRVITDYERRDAVGYFKLEFEEPYVELNFWDKPWYWAKAFWRRSQKILPGWFSVPLMALLIWSLQQWEWSAWLVSGDYDPYLVILRDFIMVFCFAWLIRGIWRGQRRLRRKPYLKPRGAFGQTEARWKIWSPFMFWRW